MQLPLEQVPGAVKVFRCCASAHIEAGGVWQLTPAQDPLPPPEDDEPPPDDDEPPPDDEEPPPEHEEPPPDDALPPPELPEPPPEPLGPWQTSWMQPSVHASYVSRYWHAPATHLPVAAYRWNTVSLTQTFAGGVSHAPQASPGGPPEQAQPVRIVAASASERRAGDMAVRHPTDRCCAGNVGFRGPASDFEPT